MTPPGVQEALGLALASLAIGLVVSIGIYVWYAVALGKLFPKLGGEPWKGWVPILNEMEILVRGGVPGWSIVFMFIPIVQFYGLYLKATAVHRINQQLGRGIGMTVLGILIPPLWASILGWGADPVDAEAYDERVQGIMQRGAPMVPQVASGPLTDPSPAPFSPAMAADPSGYSVPSGAVAPAPIIPLAEPSTAAQSMPVVSPPAAVIAEPPLAPTVAAPAGLIANPWAPAASVREEPAPAATPTLPPLPGSVEAAPAPPLSDASQSDAPAQQSEFPRLTVTPPVDLVEPPVNPPVTVFPAVDAFAVTAAPPEFQSEHEQSTAIDDELDSDDDFDSTVVVDRRPIVPWRLIADDGFEASLTATSVVLGRKPAAADGAQALAVPDATRTLSKTHARLELDDGQWTVIDLQSTNGVIVIGADGSEQLLPSGGSAPVLQRFILGKVGMRLSYEDGVDS